MRNTNFDREIAGVARRQHGTFHTRQARAIGGSAEVLRNRAANGAILQLAPKVWAVAGHPPTWRRQYKAAELSVAGSAIADRAGALVNGFDGFRVVRPTVVVGHEANRRQPLADVRRASEVAVTVVDGIRVTTPAQTLFDLLHQCELPVVERALDGALVGGSTSIAELLERQHVMERLRRPHVAVWKAMIAERVPEGVGHAESELEVLLHRLLRRLSGDVEVVFQATPSWWTEASARVDAYIPAWGLVVEADGRRWHARVADFDNDRWRDNVASAHGHRVMRFTHTHLTERPAEALALLRSAGAASRNRPTADAQ